MRETTYKTTRQKQNSNPILVDLDGLKQKCSCGRTTAERIAREAGARVQIGGTVRYNLEAIQNHLNKICE